MVVRRVAGSRSRSAATGRFVTKATASRFPQSTITERARNSRTTVTKRAGTSGRGAVARNAVTGSYATPAGTFPTTRVAESQREPGPPVVGQTSSNRRRSTPADDPLAPERTRWLADVLGGTGRLASMLAVSASQTSRWSRGEERPSADVAPLLIDLEHVLARVRLVWPGASAGAWMTGANAYLEGARPVDVLRLSGPGPVLEALDAQAWGGAA